MANKIQIRRGLASLWVSVNPTLSNGEFGYETDTGKTKIGNGVDDWNTLGYEAGGSGVSQAYVDNADALKVDKVSGESLINITDITKLAGIESGAQVNDPNTVIAPSGVLPVLDGSNLTGLPSGAAINDVAPSFSEVYSSAYTLIQLGNKVDKVAGMGLSTNDFTDSEKVVVDNTSGTNTGDQDLSGKVDKVTGQSLINTTDITKLAGIATGAQVNDPNTTLQGNTFNGNLQLIKTNGTGQYPALDGSLITGIAGGTQKMKWFSILDYGAAPGNTSTVNTTAINNAIIAAAVNSGTVYIPVGMYLVDAINYNPQVSIIGDGVGSILRSNSAVTMLTTPGSFVIYPGTISKIVFDGNNIGTIGYLMQGVVNFNYSDVIWENFTSIDVSIIGSLIGQFNSCKFFNSAIGTNGTKSSSTMANLISFFNCKWYNCSTYALNWSFGAGILIDFCDIEVCGTSANNVTGAINLSNMAASAEGTTFTLRDSWLEGNFGTVININAPTSFANYFIYNTIILSNGTGNAYGINMANGGGSGSTNTLTISNSKLTGFYTKDLLTTGAYAIVNNLYSNIGNPSFVSGAIYNNNTNGDPVFNTLTLYGASGSGTIRKANTSYRNYVINDMLLYSPSDNMSFLVDNGTKKMSFAVGMSTPSFSIFNSYVNAQALTMGTAINKANLNLQINASTTNGAQMYLTPGGSLLATPLNGAVETDGFNIYYTTGGIRYPIVNQVTSGTATLVSGTVTISCPQVSATSKICISVRTPGGTQGFLSAPAASRTVGTGFVINSSSATETSTIDWIITP